MRRWIPLLLLLASLSACTARRGEPFGPVELASEEARHGEEVFMRHCHQCHPGGEAGLGPAINNKPLPGFLIRMQVRRGLGVMPSFSEEMIPPRDVDALIAYLKELRREEKPR